VTSQDVVYESSLWRTIAATAVIALIAALIGGSVPALLRGEIPYSDADGVGFVLVFVVIFTAGSVYQDRKRPSRLRLTSEGVELFGARRDGVFVPWSVDPSYRFRGLWPLRRLEVSAADESTVVQLSRGGRPPSIRRRPDSTIRISMPLYGLGASAATVRRGFSESARSGRPESRR